MNRSKYSEQVQAGMAVLDKQKPGWECMIDPDTLDLDSCQLCLLGQIYGSYWDGKRHLGIADGAICGFSVTDSTLNLSREYKFLTKTWLRVLQVRLNAKLAKIARRFA